MRKKMKKNFFRLYAAGAGIALCMSLAGCAPDSALPEDGQEAYQEEENQEEEEKAVIYLDYQGLETLPERDIVTFTRLNTETILGIASTSSEKRDLKLPPGDYAITSNYLETEYFTVEDAREKWKVKADYNTDAFTVTKLED